MVRHEKSTADDITTRIHDDIAHNVYECPVCTSEIGPRSKVWSCTHCWSVFHLACIKKWAGNEASVTAQPSSGDDGTAQPRQWRCPGCNLSHTDMPTSYYCWCGKDSDPRPLPGLPPHSCGQTCSKSRTGCPHPCDRVCHAGPCPPCSAMGPTQVCFCGRHSSTKRCVETDYANGWSCGEVCEEMMPCLEHTCQRECHAGLCGVCEEKVEARCYCGKVTTTMLCSARDEERESELPRGDGGANDDDDGVDAWTGTFACKTTCGRLFDCGKHACQKACHPQELMTPHCPRSPDVVTHCPCGKTKLSDLPGFQPRQSCEDPVPHCDKACGKTLPCGHPCPMTCHTGACNPCFRASMVKCRCGRSEFKTLCHQGVTEPPQCMRTCKATLNCGRHTCQERCCAGERKAVERLASKRKLRSLASRASVAAPLVDDIEAEHICTRICGRPLKCGQHTCPELCHKGPCNSCREAIFDEISCNCGRTVAYPPLPCGTQPPACSRECRRPKACGHPQTAHNCHGDDEPCPKCPFLVDKRCACGKRVVKNQPCHLAYPHCGQVCNEQLKCGSHTCRKTCHEAGECEDAHGPCQQLCGKTKKSCPHPCTEKCHAPFSCPEKPCDYKMEIACPCGWIKQTKRCGFSFDKSLAGATFVAPRIACDDECARLERNRALASALNVTIDPTTTAQIAGSSPALGSASASMASAVPYSDATLDSYLALTATTTLAALQSYEQKLHDFAHSDAKRSARFAPARPALRAFVHSLAADWGFTSESFDPEPHRYVEVYRTPRWIPPAPLARDAAASMAIGIAGMSVAEGLRLRDQEAARDREAKRAAAAAAAAAAVQARTSSSQSQGGAARADMRGDGGGGGGGGGLDGGSSGGWAQVVRKKAGPAASPYGFSLQSSVGGDRAFGSGRFGALVLKSNVGRGKRLELERKASSEGEEVAEDWEKEADAAQAASHVSDGK
ncbi:FKBP12-associated protein [Ascosphaera acerosa]|nr:FKBP12-associated protein [Ascosphaera acerosa]